MAITATDTWRRDVLRALREIVGDEYVHTDPQELREASVDRFKKYTAVHGIFDGPFPFAVVYARGTDDVSRVLGYANEQRIAVVPRTGRTSTEGGLEVVDERTLVLDGSRMDAVVDINATDMTATVQCGVPLEVLETTLRQRGFTTGHSPQSKPLAQYGGLTATRSIGQFSTLYGGIEDMVIGLEAVLADGDVVRIKNVPRRAAGPDIRHIVIGNEGTLCFITEVTIKIFRFYPENNHYFGFLLDDFGTGVDALREIITSGYRPSVCRLYSPQDAAQHFSHFAGPDDNVAVFVAEGPKGLADATAAAIDAVFQRIPHRAVPSALVADWFAGLNWGQDKIDAEKAAMLATSRLGYTTEVSVSWSRVAELYETVTRRIRTEFPRVSDLTMLGGHSSHSYQNGTNLYFVYDYAIQCEPREEINEYHIPLNAIIVEESLRLGGSMVHHHGIGKYRTPWTREEHGSAYRLLEGLKHQFDPNGIMNPGSVYPRD